MGIFSKKSSSSNKIPPVEPQQQQAPHQQQQQYGQPGGAYAGSQPRQGATLNTYNSQQQPYPQPPGGGAYNQQAYQYNQPQHQQPSTAFQQTSLYKDARAPTKLGSGYDQLVGGGRGQQNGNRLPPGEEDLEAEYGAGAGASSSRYNNGRGDGGEEAQQEMTEEDEEIEGIKQQMRFTKQESLSSTRNALRIARETEETASGTILKLGEQSDKIANTERHLDMSKAHSSRADDNARDIVSLNRSIFRPTFQLDKKAKRDAEEARILNRHIEEREEREVTRAEALRSQNRADQVLTGAGTGSGRFADRFGGGRFGATKTGGALSAEEAQKNRLANRSRYQFEATGSDDELEQELEDNLDEIGHLSGRLHQLGKAMGNEIDEQNTRIQRISEKANKLDTRVYGSTQRLERIK